MQLNMVILYLDIRYPFPSEDTYEWNASLLLALSLLDIPLDHLNILILINFVLCIVRSLPCFLFYEP